MNINNINEAFNRIVKEEFDNQINNASKEVLDDKETYMERVINFLEDNLGGIKFNKNSYGDYTFENAIPEDLDEIKSLLKDLGYTPRFNEKDFISPDKSTAITTWFDGKDIRLFFVFRRDKDLTEAPEKKERAPRRPKNVCGSLEKEVEMRLADELFTSFQKTPSWPFGPGYYDIENEMGVAREDGENGFRVFTVTTPIAKDRLGKAKEIAKEYNLKTEYIGPNNTIGKSNEMLKIYIPMDAPSPFDEKRMKEWEEKTKAFKSDKNEKLDENLESNLTSDLYNAITDTLFKYKDYFDDNNSLKIYIKEIVPYLVDKFFAENPNLEESFEEWKPNLNAKHIIKVLNDVIARGGKYINNEVEEVTAAMKKLDRYNPADRIKIKDLHRKIWSINREKSDLTEDTIKKDGKWVNKGKDGTHGTFKTKKAADAQRKAMFANGYKESKSIKESVSHSFNIGDTFKNINKTFIVDNIKGDYTLVHSDELKFMPYIVAWNLSDDGSWGQGYYFRTREEAEEYLSKK